MREALKTNISKYGPKTSAAMTVENVQGKGLQLVVVYAGKKHYLSLSSVPLNPDEHANHPNHQKIRVGNDASVNIVGPIVGTRTSVNNLGANGSIPITAMCVDVDANGSARTGIRFAGTGNAGQVIIVNNTGGETLQFHGTEGTALVRGIHGDHDFMSPNGVYMFVSDGSLWNYVGGGVDTQPDEGLAAS